MRDQPGNGDPTEALPPVTVPPLPRNYVPRDAEVEALVEVVLKSEGGDSPTIGLIAVEGQGGIGKTVLGQAVCDHPKILEAFPGGILWQTIGKESPYTMTSRFRAVLLALQAKSDGAGNKQDQYRRTMKDKAALLVIDDVWSVADIEPWLAKSPRSRLLFTTRNATVAADVGAEEYRVELLSEAQARKVFDKYSASKAETKEAEEIVSECKGLPLALATVGAMLRSKPLETWRHTLKRLRGADLQKIKAQFPGYSHTNLFVAIQASVDALEPQERRRYLTLGVLLDEMAASPVMQQTLWEASEEEAAEFAERLISLCLAERDADQVSIRLHDLQLDCIRLLYPDQEALALIHGAMRLAWHVLVKHPSQFPSQMVGRLLAHENQPGVQSFLQEVSANAPVPWLRPRLPSLDAPGGALLRTLSGHSDGVNSVAMRRDGRLAISASDDGTLKVWEVESGRELRTLAGHSEEIHGVALSGDGRLAISASRDLTLKLWDVESGQQLDTFAWARMADPEESKLTPEEIRARAFPYTVPLPDRVSKGSIGEMASLLGYTKLTNSVAMSANGQLVVCASGDETPKVWYAGDKHSLISLPGHSDEITGVAMSADGRVVVSGSRDQTLKLCYLREGRECDLVGHSGWVTGVAMSADGRLVISGSYDRTLKVWEVESGREIRTLVGHSEGVTAVAITADGRLAVSASDDDTLRVWEVVSGRELRTLASQSSRINALTMSSDGRLVVSASSNGKLMVWGVDIGKELRVPPRHLASVTGVAMSAGGRMAVSASTDATLKVWDVKSGQELRTLAGHSDQITEVAMSADGRLAVSASLDQTLKVWELKSGRELNTLAGHESWITGVAMSADGRLAVSASNDQTVKVWSVERGHELHTLTTPAHWPPAPPPGMIAIREFLGAEDGVLVSKAAISGDGRVAVSACSDGTLRVWEVESGRELRILTGHSDLLRDVAMTPDGRLAISADYGGIIKVWDLKNGREIRSLSGQVAGLAISADGHLATSCEDTLTVWDLESGRSIATFNPEGAPTCSTIWHSTTVMAGDSAGRVYWLELVLDRKQLRQKERIAVGPQAGVPPKNHLFLSYCRDNQAEVAQLRQNLIAAGESVWWDHDIKGGQDWKFEIRKAMNNSYAVVLCFSRESQARTTTGIYPEALDAINAYREYAPGSIFLIPVRLSVCEIPPIEIDGTRSLERLQYIDLFPAKQRAAGLKKLLEAIQAAPLNPRHGRKSQQSR